MTFLDVLAAPDKLAALAQWHAAWKLYLIEAVGISEWEMHTHLGLLIFVAVAIVARRPLSSPLPLLTVSVAELVNEYLDFLSHGDWRWPDTSRDILVTLVWPLLLFALARLRAIPGG